MPILKCIQPLRKVLSMSLPAILNATLTVSVHTTASGLTQKGTRATPASRCTQAMPRPITFNALNRATKYDTMF